MRDDSHDPDLLRRRAARRVAELRQRIAQETSLDVLREIHRLKHAPVPDPPGELEAQRAAALATLDAIETTLAMTTSLDWMQRLLYAAAQVGGPRVPRVCPLCGKPLQVRGTTRRLRLRCPGWPSHFRATL